MVFDVDLEEIRINPVDVLGQPFDERLVRDAGVFEAASDQDFATFLQHGVSKGGSQRGFPHAGLTPDQDECMPLVHVGADSLELTKLSGPAHEARLRTTQFFDESCATLAEGAQDPGSNRFAHVAKLSAAGDAIEVQDSEG